MEIPNIFGFPIWVNLKRRIAEKHLKKYTLFRLWKKQAQTQAVSQLGVGDWINDCSGYNTCIVELVGVYRPVGKGSVLMDIEIKNERGGYCSVAHCGVEPAILRPELEKNKLELYQYWISKGEDYSNDPKYLALIGGAHITDVNGRLLESYKNVQNCL